MDFEQRLERAIERGQRRKDAGRREQALAAMTEEEFRNLHTKSRLELSEHIEDCARKISDHFPGFDFQSVVGSDGWGARIKRDDLVAVPGRAMNHEYSHLELIIRPYTAARIVELQSRGAIRNKEVLTRTHYQHLTQLDLEIFRELIDQWVLEYAEKFSAA